MISGTGIKLAEFPNIKDGQIVFSTQQPHGLDVGEKIQITNTKFSSISNMYLEEMVVVYAGTWEVRCERSLYKTVPTPIKSDSINPDHYKHGEIETIDYIFAVTLEMNPQHAFLVGNILKYISRFHKKNGLEDVKKAEWYLNKLITKIGENNENN